jgi:hypothetical protein
LKKDSYQGMPSGMPSVSGLKTRLQPPGREASSQRLKPFCPEAIIGIAEQAAEKVFSA